MEKLSHRHMRVRLGSVEGGRKEEENGEEEKGVFHFGVYGSESEQVRERVVAHCGPRRGAVCCAP